MPREEITRNWTNVRFGSVAIVQAHPVSTAALRQLPDIQPVTWMRPAGWALATRGACRRAARSWDDRQLRCLAFASLTRPKRWRARQDRFAGCAGSPLRGACGVQNAGAFCRTRFVSLDGNTQVNKLRTLWARYLLTGAPGRMERQLRCLAFAALRRPKRCAFCRTTSRATADRAYPPRGILCLAVPQLG